MDNLTINFKKLLPYIIRAFTEVYGEEYYDTISKKINRAIMISYYDIEGLETYISYVEQCKRREYAIKFLDKIGTNVEKTKKNNYTQKLDEKIEDILQCYIGGSYYGFCESAEFYAPLQAFKKSNTENPKILLINKLKIINYLLNDEHEKITEENFDLFTKTEKYLQIMDKIDKLNIVYESLLLEYRKWEEQLLPYKNFVESEKKRKDEILKEKKNLLFLDIYSKLPNAVIENTSDKTLEEKSLIVFGYRSDISSTSMIEAFSANKMEKLKAKDVSLYDKFLIINSQVQYLYNAGIDINNKEMLMCNSEEDVDNYFAFLNQDEVKKYIPSEDLISYVSSARENMYEEALKEYYMTREDFKKLVKIFGNDKNNLEYFYQLIKKKCVCVTFDDSTTMNDEIISVMLYTIRGFDAGGLLFSFIHECGHIIDQNSNAMAFESYNGIDGLNPYDNTLRKYERFNEAINDIFTLEAIERLHNKGIYLIEPQELSSLDLRNFNTTLVTKDLLQPLVSKFREQVINAKVKMGRNELIKYIGKDNFEELVDAVNKVDYLSRNYVLDTLPNDSIIVKEYFEQVERVKNIYNHIDHYCYHNVVNSTTPSFHRK